MCTDNAFTHLFVPTMASYGSVPAANGKGHGNGNGNAATTPLISNFEKEAAKVMERSLWSRFILGWFTPILHKGNEKKKLDQEDLVLIPLPLTALLNTYRMSLTSIGRRRWN
jgi:hypothetical protein